MHLRSKELFKENHSLLPSWYYLREPYNTTQHRELQRKTCRKKMMKEPDSMPLFLSSHQNFPFNERSMWAKERLQISFCLILLLTSFPLTVCFLCVFDSFPIIVSWWCHPSYDILIHSIIEREREKSQENFSQRKERQSRLENEKKRGIHHEKHTEKWKK